MLGLARFLPAVLALGAGCSANAPNDEIAEPAPSGTAGDAGGARGGGSGAPLGECPDELVGFASIAGDGVATTTGGGDTPAVRPTSAAELIAYASDARPRVIELTRSFEVPELVIASNKTLIGIGPDVTLDGGLRLRAKTGSVHNVIVKNLRVNGASSRVDGDAIQLFDAHHVWLDHVEVYDAADGNLDIVHGSSFVTVSWSKFRYSAAAPDPEHTFATLIGHADDNGPQDSGRLDVSFHHNYWAEGVTERMPRVRFGRVHSFNDYFAARGNHYCIRAGRGGRVLIENSHFEGVNSPHEFNDATDELTAHITARGNVYTNTQGTRAEAGGGTPFAVAPYPVSLDAAEDVPRLVKACAGPR